MGIRLALFGADDTLEMMQNVAEQYAGFDCIPIVFWNEHEVIEKAQPYIDTADMWLFSGQVPYSIVKKKGFIKKPMFYVSHTGSSIYKTLLNISYNNNISLENVSFDTLHETELHQLLAEAGLPGRPRFLKYYPAEMTGEELASYHFDLWKSGKTQAAVTCLRSAHLELQRLGMPVYRILPTRSAIESKLNLMLRTNKMLHFMDTQIAVQMVVVDSFFGMQKESYSSDEFYKMDIQIMEKLLTYAKLVQGSVKSAGPGRYVIFTTRGILSELTNEFTSIPDADELFSINNGKITCGIGVGKTVYEAEINAGNALLHARDYDQGSWFVVHEDKTIAGPLGETEQLSFNGDCTELQSLCTRSSLSISTLSKLKSILHKIGKTDVSAHELARNMNIEPRSARRILRELEADQLAQVIGEETLNPRGRPRKVYQIRLE